MDVQNLLEFQKRISKLELRSTNFMRNLYVFRRCVEIIQIAPLNASKVHNYAELCFFKSVLRRIKAENRDSIVLGL